MDASHEPEEWRPIPGYEISYEVSDHGRVRSLNRMIMRGETRVQVHGRILKPWSHNGYQVISLRNDGKTTKRPVHAVVLEVFVGVRPDGMDACHADGDPSNNALANLRWDTRGANCRDMVRHGTHNHARKTHCKHGHEFTPENTRLYTFRNGVTARFCRACKRADNRKRLAA